MGHVEAVVAARKGLRLASSNETPHRWRPATTLLLVFRIPGLTTSGAVVGRLAEEQPGGAGRLVKKVYRRVRSPSG